MHHENEVSSPYLTAESIKFSKVQITNKNKRWHLVDLSVSAVKGPSLYHPPTAPLTPTGRSLGTAPVAYVLIMELCLKE